VKVVDPFVSSIDGCGLTVKVVNPKDNAVVYTKTSTPISYDPDLRKLTFIVDESMIG
jgi:hypothetical protein